MCVDHARLFGPLRHSYVEVTLLKGHRNPDSFNARCPQYHTNFTATILVTFGRIYLKVDVKMSFVTSWCSPKDIERRGISTSVLWRLPLSTLSIPGSSLWLQCAPAPPGDLFRHSFWSSKSRKSWGGLEGYESAASQRVLWSVRICLPGWVKLRYQHMVLSQCPSYRLPR